MEVLMILFVAGVIVIVMMYKAARSQTINRSWKRAAQDLGLHFSPGGMLSNREIRGTHDEYPIRLWTYTEGGRRSKTTYTAAKIDIEDLPFDLSLQKDGFLQSIGTFFGARDIRIGAQPFDEKIVVKGNEPEQIRSYLTAERVSALNRFFRAFPHGDVTDQKIQAIREGAADSEREVTSMITQCVRLARLLERERTEEEQVADEAFNRGMDARNEGNLTTARAEFEKSAKQDPENVDAMLHKGDTLEMDGRFHQAAQVYLNALENDPHDPEVTKRYRRAAEHAGISEEVIQGTISATIEEAGTETTDADRSKSTGDGSGQDVDGRPEAVPVGGESEDVFGEDGRGEDGAEQTLPDAGPNAPGERGDGEQEEQEATRRDAASAVEEASSEEVGEPPGKQETLQDLFDPQATSVDVGKRFDNRYRGREVEWSAEFLERKDLDFCLQFDGDREGGLIKVLLHRGNRDTGVTRDCYGFIHLPDGVPGELEEGDAVTFTGTLYRLDEFMRNLYVSRGAVIERNPSSS